MEAKKLDFVFVDQPVKVRIYADEATNSTRTQVSGLDLSQPLSLAQIEGLKELFERVAYDAERMDWRLANE